MLHGSVVGASLLRQREGHASIEVEDTSEEEEEEETEERDRE